MTFCNTSMIRFLGVRLISWMMRCSSLRREFQFLCNSSLERACLEDFMSAQASEALCRNRPRPKFLVLSLRKRFSQLCVAIPGTLPRVSVFISESSSSVQILRDSSKFLENLRKPSKRLLISPDSVVFVRPLYCGHALV